LDRTQTRFLLLFDGIKGGDGGRAQINSAAAGLQLERARSSAYLYYHFCPNESTSDFPLLGFWWVNNLICFSGNTQDMLIGLYSKANRKTEETLQEQKNTKYFVAVL
jgi:hypothetical protein